MEKKLTPAGKKALLRFLALLAAAVLAQGMILLSFLPAGQWGVWLYVLCSYVLMPAAAMLAPFWAALGGVHPLAACLPIGGLPLLLYTVEPKVCLICIAVSLVSAVAGQEWSRRRKKEDHKRHAGKTRKR